MVSHSIVEVDDFTVGEGGGVQSYVPLSSPLQLKFRYHVSRAVPQPKWSLLFLADVAHKRQPVVLIPPTALADETDTGVRAAVHHVPLGESKALIPGESYTLELDVEQVDLSCVETKYLFHVGALQFSLVSGGACVAELTVVVQIKPNDHGEPMRLVMSPLC
uniref:Uncharacterized protein TCIL3000_11_1950 n=1 Tax=Trypanosoma congolense (strain IL3000) TaxID=1068625 RepID=G0UZJ1_TRYCI|nr:unnamed protein product [Trypanosoma congolense IL3000]